MKKSEFDELLIHFQDLAEIRTDLAIERLRQEPIYNEHYNKFSEMYYNLIKKYSRKEIEELIGLHYDVYTLEYTYIYLQGLIDGKHLEEIFSK